MEEKCLVVDFLKQDASGNFARLLMNLKKGALTFSVPEGLNEIEKAQCYLAIEGMRQEVLLKMANHENPTVKIFKATFAGNFVALQIAFGEDQWLIGAFSEEMESVWYRTAYLILEKIEEDLIKAEVPYKKIMVEDVFNVIVIKKNKRDAKLRIV